MFTPHIILLTKSISSLFNLKSNSYKNIARIIVKSTTKTTTGEITLTTTRSTIEYAYGDNSSICSSNNNNNNTTHTATTATTPSTAKQLTQQ